MAHEVAHLNAQALKQIVLKEMVSGMQSLKLDDFKEPLDCIACSMAKQRRMAYKRHNKRSKVCYDRLMSDVCSIGIETLGGNRYFQLVQDEASRYKWCYLLEHKSEATKNVINLILRLEKEQVIKRVTFDRGGEFVNNKMKNFLVDHGIALKPTNAYTPEENCLVEKQNGNLMNKVRAIREATGLPESLWGEILMYVVEVDNMSSTKALPGKTPYEKLTGLKPDVSNLRVSGCVAFAHVPKKKRGSKLSPKAVPTLFLGFSQSSLGYRLLNLLTGELIERRGISFREDITVDSSYVQKPLVRRYKGDKTVLPDIIPYVRLPVNGVLDTVHIPNKASEDDSDTEAAGWHSDTEMRPSKRQRLSSSDSSSNESDDIPFSGSFGNVADDRNSDTSSLSSSSGSSRSRSSSVVSHRSASSGHGSTNSPQSGSSSSSSGSSLLSLPSSTSGSSTASPPASTNRVNPATSTTATATGLRRSTRQRRQPSRFDPSSIMTITLMSCMLIGIVSKLLNPTTVRQALASEYAPQWREAMNVEYESLMKNLTWELVPRPKSTKERSINILTSLWVLVVKRNEKGEIDRFKARLAIRGFLQKYGIDYLQTFSPVVRIESVRLVMIIALMQGLDCRHVDFVTAFLNGKLVDVEIYMEQPEGYSDGTNSVCRLLKRLYGLKQASKIWNDTLHAYLRELKFQQCVFDAGVYYRKGVSGMIYLTVYVDDIIIAAQPSDIDIVVRELGQKFELKDLRRVKHLLGMEIIFEPGVMLCISQTAYIERMATKFRLDKAKSVRSPQMHNERMPAVEKDKSKINDGRIPYREMIGSLQFVVACTRPDMANVVRCLGKYNGAYTRENFIMAKRAIRYLIGTKHLGLVYRPIKASPLLNAFSDADLAMCKDTSRSTTGFVLKLNDCAWMWKSKQQGRVTSNTCASELVAASDCVDNLVWAQQLLDELKITQGVSTVYCGNHSTIQVIANRGNSKKVQRFAKEARMIAEFVDDGALIVDYVSTTENAADIFTKALGPQRFEYLRDKLGVDNVLTAWETRRELENLANEN